MTRNFRKLLEERWKQGCFVCVGLDSDYEKIPKRFKQGDTTDAIASFNKWIIDQTSNVACAYKPNLAFYLAKGRQGLEALELTIACVARIAPHVPVILDGKFGDIGNTSDAYAKFAFDELGVDAVTLNPYMGIDAAQSFQRTDKGIFVLCRTSNDSARQLQDLTVYHHDGLLSPLYQDVAMLVGKEWSATGHYGLVVGATAPAELAVVRGIVGDDIPILIPGIGAQGGEIEATVKAGKRSILVNSSRGIIFKPDPGAEARLLNDSIKSFL